MLSSALPNPVLFPVRVSFQTLSFSDQNPPGQSPWTSFLTAGPSWSSKTLSSSPSARDQWRPGIRCARGRIVNAHLFFSKNMHGVMQCLSSSALGLKGLVYSGKYRGRHACPQHHTLGAGKDSDPLAAASPWLPAVLGSKAKGNSKAKAAPGLLVQMSPPQC